MCGVERWNGYDPIFSAVDNYVANPRNSIWKDWKTALIKLTEYVEIHPLDPSDKDRLLGKVTLLHSREKSFFNFFHNQDDIYYLDFTTALRGNNNLKRQLDKRLRSNDFAAFAKLLFDAKNNGVNIDELLKEEFSCHNLFFEKVRENPDWLLDLFYPPCSEHSYDKPRILDLRGIYYRDHINQVLQANARFVNQHIIMQHIPGQYDLLYLTSDEMKNCTFLDLRGLDGINFNQIYPKLKSFKRLNNVLLPANVKFMEEIKEPFSIQYSVLDHYSLIYSLVTALPVDSIKSKGVFNPSCGEGFEIVARIAKGSKDFIHAPHQIIANALLQLEKSLEQISFFRETVFNSLDVITESLLRKMNFAGVESITLTHCINLTSEAFRALYEVHYFKSVSIEGSKHITDAYFDNHPLLKDEGKYSKHTLNLIATSVTLEMVEKIRKAQPGIVIKYDETMLAKYRKAERLAHISLETENFRAETLLALCEYHETGYLPQMSIDIALELLVNKGRILGYQEKAKALDRICIQYILSNLTQANVLSIYKFAKEHKFTNLQADVKKFICVFCHPHIPEYWNKLSADQQKTALEYLADLDEKGGLIEGTIIIDDAEKAKIAVPSIDIFGDDDL